MNNGPTPAQQLFEQLKTALEQGDVAFASLSLEAYSAEVLNEAFILTGERIFIHNDRKYNQAITKLATDSRVNLAAVFSVLIETKNIDPSKNNNFAIGWAAKNGYLPVVERLLQDDRVNPAANYNYAICFAAEFGHLPVVERLLQDKRVNPAAVDNRPIRVAAKNGHLPVVERLLKDNRVNPAADENFALRLAAKSGHLPVVARLLKEGADQLEALKLFFPGVFDALVKQYFDAMNLQFTALVEKAGLPSDFANVVITDINPVGKAGNLCVAYNNFKQNAQEGMEIEQRENTINCKIDNNHLAVDDSQMVIDTDCDNERPTNVRSEKVFEF